MGRSLVMFIILLHLLSLVIFAELGGSQSEFPSRCGNHGPDIRFPFWLKDRQLPDHCGYPGFDLYCDEKNQTVMELPSSVKLLVKNITYKSQEIQVYDQHGCLPRQLPYLDLSASPFSFKSYNPLYNYTLFNCSSTNHNHNPVNYQIDCLGVPDYHVVAISSDNFILRNNLLSCTKIYDISSVPVIYEIIYQNVTQLQWSYSICGHCEAEGRKCRLKNNNCTTPETECFGKPPKDAGTTRLEITGAIFASILLVLGVVLLYRAHRLDKIEKENQVKIEKFLEDYRTLKPTRYSYADIKRITNYFKEKLGQGGYGTVFKGKLSNEILVAVKILDNFTGNGEEFINEVGTMATIHHINVVRLVGFCAEGFQRALVYEFLPNESLEKFIFSADDKKRFLLGWEKLQDISVGIAKGIEYLHQGCDQRILHFDIKPHNILLDENFNAKISDFGLAKLCSKDQSVVSMTAARGTIGYIAPEVLSRNFGNVSSKSDVYSFGMLLLEMVGGRKNIDVRVENPSQVYFPEWIYNHLNQGEELRIRIEEEGDAKIAKKLTIVGLWCIQWYPMDRPSMKVVVQMLEGKGDNLSMPPNPFASTSETRSSTAMPRRPFMRELALIPESD